MKKVLIFVYRSKQKLFVSEVTATMRLPCTLKTLIHQVDLRHQLQKVILQQSWPQIMRMPLLESKQVAIIGNTFIYDSVY